MEYRLTSFHLASPRELGLDLDLTVLTLVPPRASPLTFALITLTNTVSLRPFTLLSRHLTTLHDHTRPSSSISPAFSLQVTKLSSNANLRFPPL